MADPMTDPMAPDVIAAFETAERAGLSLRDCYLASVEIWCRAYPEQRREYAAMQATAIILKSRLSLLIPRDDLTAHADRSDCSSDRVEPS
jgi:hypothetical protein